MSIHNLMVDGNTIEEILFKSTMNFSDAEAADSLVCFGSEQVMATCRFTNGCG